MSDDIHLTTPLSESDVRNLRIGDFVYLDGQIHTGRAGCDQSLTQGHEVGGGQVVGDNLEN